MKTIERLQNPIQDYAWGSHTAISELLGQPNPTGKPQAELWMGAHPKSSSEIFLKGQRRSLIELLQKCPAEILGKTVAAQYSNRLPFLFKVLAASSPLSIQAHPNRDQALKGFLRENQKGLPLDSNIRNYRDPNHKPEIICALAPFSALSGFRRIEKIQSLLQELLPSVLEREASVLVEQPNPAGLKHFFRILMTNSAERNRRIITELLEMLDQSPSHHQEATWIRNLQTHFPGDVGVLSPILLNLVQLKPGEALFLPAGELHAYLEGVGIELMANSDNVLRGGLTTKHVAVEELLNVLTFEPRKVEILSPVRLRSGEKLYHTPAKEFLLASIELSSSRPFTSKLNRSVEILICIQGKATIRSLPTGRLLKLVKGNSVLVPSAVEQYQLEGEATLYRASVP